MNSLRDRHSELSPVSKAQAKESDISEIRKSRMQQMKESIHAVLTPEQQTKLAELKKARAEQAPMHKRCDGPRGRSAAFEKVLGQLELTEEQQKQIAAINKETTEKIKALLSGKPAEKQVIEIEDAI